MTSRIIFDTKLMKLMSFFESITHARLKDCLEYKNSLTFIVQPGQIGKAIGKKGVNAKRLEQKLNKKIRIVEFSDDVTIFTKNLIYPLRVNDVKEQDKTVTVYSDDVKTKGLLIGRNSQNLRNTEKTVKRYFDIEKIKVE